MLQAERADRRAGVLQTVTINSVAAAALLNIGVTLNGQGAGGPATSSFLAAGEYLSKTSPFCSLLYSVICVAG